MKWQIVRVINISNEWPKNLTRGRIAGDGFFTGGECNVTLTSRQHCSPLQKRRSDTFIDCLAAYNATVTSQCFSIGRTTPKLPISHGDLAPHPKTWFLGPIRVSLLNGISIGSAVFARLTNMTKIQTHSQIDIPRYYFVRSNRPHLAIAAMRPKTIC